MTMQKMVDLMKSEEGKSFDIEIERKDKKITLSFTLEDPIPYQE